MKKLMKSLMLFAAAAMALTSCENEIMDEGIEVNDTYTLNFIAGAPENKTSVEINGTNATFKWDEEGETFHFIQNTADGLKKGTNVSYNRNADYQAEITATFTETNSPIVAVYPEKAWVGTNNDNYNKAKLIVSGTQALTAGTFDPNADLMISKAITPNNATDTHLLQFGRLVAIGKMTIKNLPVKGTETIEKVNFSISSKNALTGRLYVDLATGKVSEWGYQDNAFKEISLINGTMDAAAANDIYFTCMPSVVAAGETFTVKVTTDKAIYTHSVTIPEGKSINFSSGRVSAFGVNMTSATREDNNAIALPWSEGFDSEDLSAYTIVNGESDTKVWPDDVLAGGTKGEILIGKKGGSMTATIASDGTAKTLYLSFKSNHADYITISSTTTGVTIAKINDTSYTVDLTKGVRTFKLTLENETDKNTRVDDILLSDDELKVTLVSISVSGQTTTFEVGDTFAFNGTVTAKYNDNTTAPITGYTVDNSAVKMDTAGTYTVKVTYEGKETSYTITVKEAQPGGGESVAETKTITYTVTSTSAVSKTGVAPDGASATYSSTYSDKYQLTSGHSMTLTLSGYNGVKITGLTMSMKSNTSKGGGSYSMKVGTTTISSITGAKFNTSSWNNAWSTSYVDIKPAVTPTTVGANENIVITITATENSLYCQSFTLTYEVGGTSGGGSTEPEDPETPKDVELEFTVSNTTIENTEHSATIPVKLNEYTGEWLIEASTPDEDKWIGVEWNNGVSYIVEANNTENSRETTVTLIATYGTKEVTKTFTITQAAGGSVEQSKTYTLQFGSKYNSKALSSYSNSWSATCDGFTWNITNANNNNNSWSYIKMGSKSAAYTGTITTNTSIPEAIKTVTMTVGAITTSKITSITLYVATDSAFSSNLQTISVTPKQGDLTFTVPTPTANCYYKIEVVCQKASNNGPIQINKVTYAN